MDFWDFLVGIIFFMILLAVLKRLIGLFLSVISVDLRFRVDRRRICIFGLVVVMVWSVEVLMVFI